MSKGKENWIKGAIKKPGAFSAQAEKAGMSTSEFAEAVTENPDKYSEKTVKRAQLAKTLAGLRKKKKKGN
jgi:hypothetical protein